MPNPILTLTALKQLLSAAGLRPRQRLGQHFLIDPVMQRRVIAAAGLRPDECVMEIGPGLGALTLLLAQQARRVIAVEVDRGLAAALTQRTADLGNLEVRCENILEYRWPAAPSAWVVVGTIPYYITAPILERLVSEHQRVARAVLVMQTEVAERLTAQAGAEAYGRLSCFVQYYFQARRLFRIAPRAFYPMPAVESSAVELIPHGRPPVHVGDEALFFRVIEAAFHMRRKTLLNNLLAAFGQRQSREQLSDVLQRCGIDLRERGERLSLEQFAQLADALTP